ncbi:innexin unc-7-like [Pecten maximus]|uniref:innexin unc-7-like n=1 Tax=Pecten maximus TaxID=6579 RepID=UPI001458AD00|nr:innexin unc-7-like [Pecten maximus]
MDLMSFRRHLSRSNIRLNDLCGKLNSTWTLGILVLFSLLTFYLHTAYDPVTCWTPAEFTSQMIRYTNKICWESSTYYPINGDPEPMERPMTSEMKKPPYRWIPLVLLVQALLFKLPDLILSVGQGVVGFRFTKISGLTDGYESLNMADRAQMGREVGRYMKSWIDSTVWKGCSWGWLTLLFLFTKLLYFINAVTQLSAMNIALKSENQSSFGTQLAGDILSYHKSSWRSSNLKLPEVFTCDFSIMKLQTLHRYSTQCLINNVTYYEMMFGFIWLWLVIVIVTTTISSVVQFLQVLVPVFRRRFVKRYLHMSDEMVHSPSDNDIARFAGTEITEDGVFILKAIGEISSEHLVRDILIYLWGITHAQRFAAPRSQYIAAPSTAHHDRAPESHQLEQISDHATCVGAYTPIKE